VQVTGRVPGSVAGDRGFGTAANDRGLAALGVARIGVQRKGTLSAARAAQEHTRRFRRLRNWRIGIEARISHSSVGSDCGAPGCGALRVPEPGWAGDLRLQPAADDRRGRPLSLQADDAAPTDPVDPKSRQSRCAHHPFFRGK
jgi:hypothetical protein